MSKSPRSVYVSIFSPMEFEKVKEKKIYIEFLLYRGTPFDDHITWLVEWKKQLMSSSLNKFSLISYVEDLRRRNFSTLKNIN